MSDFKQMARQVRSAQEDIGALAPRFQGMTDADLIAFADEQDDIAAAAEWSADMARTELNLRELRRPALRTCLLRRMRCLRAPRRGPLLPGRG